MSRVRYFSSPVANANTLRALAQPTNTAYSVNYRVHSYLTVNCAQCHQPGGTALGDWDMRIATPLSQSGIINGALINNRGDTNNRLIAPGSLEHSMMLTRTATRGSGQMPPLDSTVPDTNALNLLSSWITNDLPQFQSFADWQIAHFGSTNAPDAAPDADPDNDGANNLLEYLTGTDAMTGGDAWGMRVRQSGNAVEISYLQIANRGFQIEWTPSLSPPVVWQPLAVSGNRPSYPLTSLNTTISDAITDTLFKYYLVRVFEP